MATTERTASVAVNRRFRARRTAVAELRATNGEPAPTVAGRPRRRGALFAAELSALEAALKRARTKHRVQTQRPAKARALLAAARERSEHAYRALRKAAASLEGQQGQPARPGVPLARRCWHCIPQAMLRAGTAAVTAAAALSEACVCRGTP